MRYTAQPTAHQDLGFKEIAWYLNGRLQLTEAIELLQRDTRRYAKRQLSWFKRNKDIKWFNLSKLSGQEVMARIIEQWEIH